MAQTGNTTTLTFSGGLSLTVEEIGGAEETLEAIEDSHLGTTGKKTKIPSDLADPGTLTVRFQWDQSAGTFPSTGAVQTITRTFPLKSGETVPATEAGSGFISRVKGPDTKNAEKMMGELTVTWDGKTGPTYTAGS